MALRVGIVHLGAANYASIGGSLERFGAHVRFVQSARELGENDALIFPGVANFGFVADALREREMQEPLVEVLQAGMPFLGICAGFQILFKNSAEAPAAHGLGIFDGRIEQLVAPKLPHIGWNRIEPLSTDIPAGWAYFAHTYAPVAPSRYAAARTVHGGTFTSIARERNVVGVQFHPERSGRYGMAVLQKFLDGAADAG